MCTTSLFTHLMIAQRMLATRINGILFLLLLTTCPKYLEADLFEPAIKTFRGRENIRNLNHYGSFHREQPTRRGWEVRMGPLAVWAASGREDALWIMDQATLSWQQIETLAGNWKVRMNNRRRVPVSIMVDNQVPRSKYSPVPYLQDDGNSLKIFMNNSSHASPISAQLPQLQRSIILSFFHAEDVHQTLPKWFQHGIATYLTNQQVKIPSSEQEIRYAYPNSDSTYQNGVFQWRKSQNSWQLPDTIDQQRAVTWVRFLLEGDDARYAPQVATIIREMVERSRQNQPVTPIGLAQLPAHLTTPVVKTPLDNWLRSNTFEHRIKGWLSDHDVDQPVFKVPPHSRPNEIEKFKEMVLILKLARRLHNPWSRADQPFEFGKGDERGLNLDHFYRQLTNPHTPEWATIDTDGSVLNSNNHSRLAQIFSGKYQTKFHLGRTILIHDNLQNRPLKAWLEENPDHPRRPMAMLRFANPQQDIQGQTMIDRNKPESHTTTPWSMSSPKGDLFDDLFSADHGS